MYSGAAYIRKSQRTFYKSRSTTLLPATELAGQFADVSRPAISQHLTVLKEAELVTERRDGTRRLYRANPQTMAELRAFLDDYWTSGLERLRDAAEAEQDRKRTEDHNAPKAPKTGRQ